MIAIDLPEPLLWALRWLLFLGPFAAAIYLGARVRHDQRTLVGCLFAFLYGLGLIFATHILAIAMGWWHYGGNVLMLGDIPADIWIGGAILFGPVLYLAFPSTAPLWLAIPIVIGLHGTLFLSLRPLVYPGHNWFVGVVLVFAIAHIPALYLARWTNEDRHLAYRAALLAVGYGFLAFMVLPALIMHAMGETFIPASRPLWLVVACAIMIGPFFIMGLSAVQLFVVHGKGTPVPLDPTQRLVRNGIFSYVTNPMQVTSAATWILIGVALGSVWVASAAVMAWVFVAGMVRWHNRNDLLKRFPEDWLAYRANVPEWIPNWRPWVPNASRLHYDPGNRRHSRVVRWLNDRTCTGLMLVPEPGSPLTYIDAGETTSFLHTAAVAKGLDHTNLAGAIFGAAILLVALPCQYAATRWKTRPSSDRFRADAT
jgi:protein-S-isoprenylcysteine O-methyltransferase Ste14